MSLDAALAAAKRDWASFPLLFVDGKKVPAVKWREWATTDVPTLVAEWSGRSYPAAGIECAKSRLVVIDEDTLGEFQRLASSQDEAVPDTYTVRTGRSGGGRQFYFAADGHGIRNTKTLKLIGFNIDVKGAGGYVVAAGSLHPSGATYQVERDVDPAPLPTWLVDLLNEQPGGATTTSWTDPDVDQLVDNGIPAGQDQDDALRDVVWKLRGQYTARSVTRAAWREIVAKTTLTKPEPWTEKDFERHWSGADKKIPPPPTVIDQEAGGDPLGTVSLGDAPGNPPQPLTPSGLPVWPGLIHVLAGPGESCKSLIAANVIVHTVRAGHNVLILDGEMSRLAWENRLLELGLTRPELLQHVRYKEITEKAADVDDVRATIAIRNARLIVWDSALSVISRTAQSENDNAAVARVYDRLRNICRDGPAGLIVDHVANGAGTMISRGATAKFNAVDIAYGVRLTGGSIPNHDDRWTAKVTIEKDRHGMFEKRRDREVTFQPLGERALEIDVAELNGATHRLTVVSDVDLVAKIAALNPPAGSGNAAFKTLGGNRKAVLEAFKQYQKGI